MIGRTLDELRLGDEARLTRTVTADTIREFVDATGDDNPIHSDPAFAAGTRFGRVIAPGILTGGMLSAVIGTRLPGPGTVYLSQSFRFLRPVYVGDTVTARVDVAEIVPERNRVRLRTACTNQDGEPVLEGEAWVMPTRQRVEYTEPGSSARALGSLACLPARLAVHAASLWATVGLTMAGELGGRSRTR